MKRRPLYSRSGKPRTEGGSSWVKPDGITPVYAEFELEEGPGLRERARTWWRGFYGRHNALVLVVSSALVTLMLIGGYDLTQAPPQHLTQKQIDAAVNYSIDQRPPDPAPTAVAYAKIIPSVVRIDGYDPAGTGSADEDSGPGNTKPAEPTAPGRPLTPKAGTHEPGKMLFENTAVGSGVVINEDGTILTNLHVAMAASRLKVTFADGSESDAMVVGTDPKQDLAIVKPARIPDDLKPATLTTTAGLNPGDQVEAVGFPFGIGPSATAGVVSGLKREFQEEGRGKLTNLIQFDAAANPGNSGGPLVNRDGEVVGIVTGILNPSGQRTFAGIGFAVPIENATAGAGQNPL